MSIRSPKAKYLLTVTLDKAREDVGGDIYTSDNIDELKSWAEQFAKGEGATVNIRKNKKKYPEFDWEWIECYKINQ